MDHGVIPPAIITSETGERGFPPVIDFTKTSQQMSVVADRLIVLAHDCREKAEKLTKTIDSLAELANACDRTAITLRQTSDAEREQIYDQFLHLLDRQERFIALYKPEKKDALAKLIKLTVDAKEGRLHHEDLQRFKAELQESEDELQDRADDESANARHRLRTSGTLGNIPETALPTLLPRIFTHLRQARTEDRVGVAAMRTGISEASGNIVHNINISEEDKKKHIPDRRTRNIESSHKIAQIAGDTSTNLSPSADNGIDEFSAPQASPRQASGSIAASDTVAPDNSGRMELHGTISITREQPLAHNSGAVPRTHCRKRGPATCDNQTSGTSEQQHAKRIKIEIVEDGSSDEKNEVGVVSGKLEL